jgi:assimilatory nitrate reductase catalytic subunit
LTDWQPACIKGWSAASLLNHPDRLRTPLVRTAAGRLDPVSWETAIGHVAAWMKEIRHKHGRDALAVVGGGSLTNEKAYLLGKFARVALGTSNIDSNGRFCMSSAAAAATKAFGLDRGLPFPLSDIPHAEVILLAGSNLAETMPPVIRYFEAQQVNGGKLVVVDPRRSPTALLATRHVQLRPAPTPRSRTACCTCSCATASSTKSTYEPARRISKRRGGSRPATGPNE